VSQPAFDFGDDPLDDAANPTYTVGELADAINAALRRGFSDGVWVRGEIDGLSNRGPHTYFSLVEHGDDGKAVLNVQLFAPMKRNLTPVLKKHRLELRDGMKVRIFGTLDFWAQGGRLGLKMAGIDPRYTLGDIAQTRDATLRSLVADGLIDANARRALSAVPLRVGVVASVGTAAWHDFHDELDRSALGFQLTVVDTRVQGEGAERMLTAALGTLGDRPGLDVIVLIRGGGARNELAVFDAESIARAIATSPIPVITGLGHEIDRSVADEVAHTSLKTPTACAGALVDRVATYLTRCEEAYAAIGRASRTALTGATNDLSETAHRIARRTHAAVERADERLGRRRERLHAAAPTTLSGARRHVDDTQRRLTRQANTILERAGHRLDLLETRSRALDPTVQLARGWSITRGPDGAVVRSIADVTPGDTLVTYVGDGSVTSTTVGTRETAATTRPHEED
jgi:exodeoxyribonuclease VII large subunit